MATPPSLPPAELEELLQLVKDAKTTSYFAVAALTFLLYDHILSFDKEMTFIWRRSKSLASYIYIWVGISRLFVTVLNLVQNRYFTLIITCINTSVFLREMKTDEVCGAYTQFLGASATFIVASVDAILLLRVWILFGKSRRLIYFLVPLMTAELGAMFFLAAYTIKQANHYAHIGPVLSGCYSLTVPKFFTLYPVPSLVVTSTMFVMTVHNCRARLGTFRTRNGMPLVNLFLRDGIYWFLAVVAVNPPQIVLWAAARPTLTDLLIVPSIVVYSIIGSRVLLNIMEIMAFGVPNYEIEIISA
ncbi:hypothetical protein C8R46DRAFT_1362562 [Mycena filopes]|nr:hypothetical protein C8R46DRAFT_1362562 [Mycena filopes]